MNGGDKKVMEKTSQSVGENQPKPTQKLWKRVEDVAESSVNVFIRPQSVPFSLES